MIVWPVLSCSTSLMNIDYILKRCIGTEMKDAFWGSKKIRTILLVGRRAYAGAKLCEELE